ncbi:MAG: afr 1 [Chthoniobacteraceae bacterium]|nr:afr 1 [Chthoniobacteraceae bacterium]
MNTTRRSFIKSSAAAVLGFPAFVRAANLNSTLQVAVVGCSGQGLSDLMQIGSHPKVKFTGFCDVDTARFGGVDAKFPGVAHFQDFREMFSLLGDKFDALQVSTPDHMHAFISLDAMRLGKHVYCQKPLTHTVWEARQMRLQAAKSKVITQMGNQIHSDSTYRTGVKLLRDGVIGKIKEVHSWQGNHGNGNTRLTALPPSGPVPESLNWDAWLGVAALRDFAPDAYHPFKWRDWQEFGGGTMGDFACHIFDPVFTALELTAPLTIHAENEGLNSQTWPFAETISYLFPGTAFTAGKTIPVIWYDGGRKPDISLAQMPADKVLPSAGSLFIGEGGVLILPHYAMPQLYPQEKFEAFNKVAGANHYHAWVDAVIEGKQTTDSFEYAGPLTEAVQLGNVATRTPGVTLQWDAATMRIPNQPEAERLLTKQYREGWKIAAVE